MKRIAIPLLALLFLGAAFLPAGAEQPGRTDGSEGSEYGQGGYPFGGPAGRFYISPAFGSGIFDRTGSGRKAGLLYSLDVGYERDQWIGIQAGLAYLSDRKLAIYSLGSRFAYGSDPFVYSFTAQAGIYDPSAGSTHFGLAPGAGIDVVVNDRVRIGLDYKHDFIFSNPGTDHIDRVYAGLRFYF